MLIPKEKIALIQGFVKKFSAGNTASNQNARAIVSVDDFLTAIRAEGYQVNTYVSDLSEDSHAVKGFFVSKQDDSYDVVLLRELNPCWKRLVLCKELFHVLLDSAEYRDMDISSLIDGAVSVAITETQPSNALLSEIMAEVAAMEFLFPYVKRQDEIQKKTLPKDVAEKYKCPLILVEKYLHPKNMEDMKQAFS